jgi:hypothetical protein
MSDDTPDKDQAEQPEGRTGGQRRGPQTFEGLGSLRQALATARTAAPTPAAAPVFAPVPEDVQPKRDEFGRSYATGKRKNAVARVWIKPGNGKIEVNGRDSPVYFARPVLRMLLNQPFVVTDRLGQFDRAAAGLEAWRLPDPRQPRRRAQEIRQAQGPPPPAILEAVAKKASTRRTQRHREGRKGAIASFAHPSCPLR